MGTARYLLLLALTAAFTVALTGSAEAALIYGSIRVGGAPLASHGLTLSCPTTSYSTMTDGRGSYSFKPNEKGQCTLSLTYEGTAQPLTYTVYSQDAPGRCDLEVVHGEDGRWTLRRQ